MDMCACLWLKTNWGMNPYQRDSIVYTLVLSLTLLYVYVRANITFLQNPDWYLD